MKVGQYVKLNFIPDQHALQWIAFYDLGIHDNIWTIIRIDPYNVVEPYEVMTLDRQQRIITCKAHANELTLTLTLASSNDTE